GGPGGGLRNRALRCLRAGPGRRRAPRLHPGGGRRARQEAGGPVIVACGFDHAGFPLKREVLEVVRETGHEPLDLGTDSTDPVDYPDIALAVSRAVLSGDAERGVLCCGSGAGVSVAATKVTGIRAATVSDGYTAHQAVEHDDV